MPPLPHLERPLSDGQVALREWTADDVPAMTPPLDEPAIARWTRVPSPYRREHSQDFLARMEEARTDGRELALAIVPAADDGRELLGSISVRVESRENRRGELGYLVFAPARGQGVAPRAVRLLAGFAFERLDLARGEILAALENRASQTVAERAGFTREGVLRSYMELRGERHDMVAFSLLAGEV